MRSVKITSILILFLFILPVSAKAETRIVTSTDLIENASALDGDTVVYSGEVVGDILSRGDYAWINVSDGANSIGIYIPKSQAEKIEHVGRYRVVGDTVSLTGTFHRACAEHGGDMDIHADFINVTKSGYTEEDNPSAKLLVTSGALSLCALAGAIFVLKKKVCVT